MKGDLLMNDQRQKEKKAGPNRLLPGGRWGVILAGIAVLFLLTGFFLGQSVAADSGLIPGSEQDPLVTASWVEAKLEALTRSLKEEFRERESQEDRMQQPEGGERPRPGEPIVIAGPAPAYTVVVVEAGKQMHTGEGTEFILRSGRVKALVPLADTGLVNLTTGKTLNDGDLLERDNLLLSPRDDGRGIVTETQAIFLIKGLYKIV